MVLVCCACCVRKPFFCSRVDVRQRAERAEEHVDQRNKSGLRAHQYAIMKHR